MNISTLGYYLCGIGNVNGCPTAHGVVGFTYRDMNSNCVKDSGDLNIVNVPMNMYNTGSVWMGQTYTAVNGVYDFPDSAGIYKVVVDTTGMPFEVQCAHPGADSVVIIATIDTNVNFSLTCKSGFDVGVQSIIPIGLVFPGTQHNLSVVAGDLSQWYRLNCAKGDSGTV
ncbi:MAG TPA: SdrD B-like domain-containing protein, partial [Bacteroidia bacterium]|nr:SdrD B-like domain-containing protein [Bacteroidia bacterium]